MVITSNHCVYLHALKDFFADHHTAASPTSEMVNVTEEIGHDNFTALVMDNAANMRKLHQNICDKYHSILGLRRMPHLINLVTQDIMMH